MKFYIMDAFTDELFGGNPAGVVLLDEEKDFPTDEIMRKTAAELRYSETAFVKRLGKNEFQTRYFTPAEEVDLCGHATIGAFAALKQSALVTSGVVYKNKTLAGDLAVSILNDSILMDMSAPVFIDAICEDKKRKELYAVMGLDPDKPGVMKDEKALLPELISTGLPDIMLPVKDEDELNQIAPDFPALSKLSEGYKVVGVHAFTLDTADGHVHCRNFAPLYAIDEEAATGTSNGALTYYLYKNGIIASGATTCFIQGEKMNRPSKIISHIIDTDTVKIQVGGSAVMLASGDICL